MFLVFLAVTLTFAAASPTRRSEESDASSQETPVLDSLLDFPDKNNLNEIFREVEDLMKDSQSKLANAVKEMEAAEKSEHGASLNDLPPNYHNATVKETKVGNDTVITREEIHKETDKNTGSTYLSQSIVSSLHSGGNKDHECIVDEDCGVGGYCQLSDFHYRCRRCEEQEMCARDGECCDGRLCVWGRCTESKKGESGSICEKQNDCAAGLCCAVHSDLLFPVCTPLLDKGDECRNPTPLLDLFSWDLEADAPLNQCPCASGLMCRAESDGAAFTCEDLLTQNKREESVRLPLLTAVPQEEIFYEDDISPTGAELGPPEELRDGELDRLVDYI